MEKLPTLNFQKLEVENLDASVGVSVDSDDLLESSTKTIAQKLQNVKLIFSVVDSFNEFTAFDFCQDSYKMLLHTAII